MPGPAGYADQVAGFDFDGNHGLVCRMDVENPAAMDDEADLVFIVPVFPAEFCQHGVQPRCLRVHVNDIRRDVASARFQLFNFCRVRLEDFFGGGVGFGRVFRIPDLIIDADRLQKVRYFDTVSQGMTLFGYSDYRHVSSIMCRRPTDSSRNSRISTCRVASPRSWPQV